MVSARIITALVLGGAVVWAILSLDSVWIALAFGAFLVQASFEWARLGGLRSLRTRLAYAVLVTASGAALWWLLERLNGGGLPVVALSAWALAWLVLMVRLSRYRPLTLRERMRRLEQRGRSLGTLALGVPVLIAPWIALTNLHRVPETGPALVLFALAVVWAADTGAYVIGGNFGRRPFVPFISPGKTMEGVAGALAFALPVIVAAALALEVPQHKWGAFIAVGLLVTWFAVIGDLFESVLKREAGVKHSGQLLPGHGGVLDRIDSLLAGTPIFLLGLMALGLLPS